jgi:hypothetical protein
MQFPCRRWRSYLCCLVPLLFVPLPFVPLPWKDS